MQSVENTCQHCAIHILAALSYPSFLITRHRLTFQNYHSLFSFFCFSSTASNAFFKSKFLEIWVIINLVTLRTFLSLILPLNINITRKKSDTHCTESFKSSKTRISIKWEIKKVKTFFSLCFKIFLVDGNSILHYW